MNTDNLGIKVEKPHYSILESGGASVSDDDHETDDADDVEPFVEKSRMGVPSSWVEGVTEDAAALGVKSCLESAGVFEQAMDLHNNQWRWKRRTMILVEDE
jgi:hypothetical protein